MAGGIHGLETSDADGRMNPDKVGALLAEAGAEAAYAVKALSW